MLSRVSRASTKTVATIFKEGKSLSSPHLTFKFVLTNKSTAPRISFIAPKSVAKFAVKRNLLRRRGYAALKKHINDFPSGLVGVVVFKKYQDDVSIIEYELKDILNKIN